VSKAEIYYFSGTGNSLHIAKEIQKRLPEVAIIPIVSILEDPIIKTDSDMVGFVFPTYCTTVPAPVSRFLEKIDLSSSKYVFSITTRLGTKCLSNLHVQRMLKKKGKTLDATFIINMANNSPAGVMPVGDKNWARKVNREAVDKLEPDVQRKIEVVVDCLLNQRKCRAESSNILNRGLEVMMSSIAGNNKTEIPFYADSDCNGCGLCEKVCLSNKITMTEGKPEWDKEKQCYFCYACFNFCPQQAILIKNRYSGKNGRYAHPQINALDIAQEKEAR
jgi:ferredoxin/flavodoxin